MEMIDQIGHAQSRGARKHAGDNDEREGRRRQKARRRSDVVARLSDAGKAKGIVADDTTGGCGGVGD